MFTNIDFSDLLADLEILHHCQICPRNCGVDRFTSQLGYCQLSAQLNISSIALHKGEEPVLVGDRGTCNIFFPHCNLQCCYCQNYQISNNKSCENYRVWTLPEILEKLIEFLDQKICIIGFVSPSHCIPQMKIIIKALRRLGRSFTTVYNTNGYDKVSTLQELADFIDVYLPDFKYIRSEISKKYSQADDYPEVALLALKEMYRQKGSYISVNERGYIESGLIIRHLVLPGPAQDSIRILESIADNLSPAVHISLMSQYYPTYQAHNDPSLNRTLTTDEYKQVVKAMGDNGFYHGWIQELQSQTSYRPDFHKDRPFEL